MLRKVLSGVEKLRKLDIEGLSVGRMYDVVVALIDALEI